MRARDSQRSKLYRWENATIRPLDGGRRLTFEQATALVQWAAQQYGISSIPVEPKHHGHATGGRAVRLPKWALVESVVLHEAAHGITHALLWDKETGWHGKDFVRVYLDLAERHYGKAVSKRALRASLRVAKLKIAAPGRCPILSVTEAGKLSKLRAAYNAAAAAERETLAQLQHARLAVTETMKASRADAVRKEQARADKARERWNQRAAAACPKEP